jgi:hypothetical protein
LEAKHSDFFLNAYFTPIQHIAQPVEQATFFVASLLRMTFGKGVGLSGLER